MNTIFATCNEVDRGRRRNLGARDIIPSGLKIPLYIFQKVHAVWKAYRKATIYLDERKDALLFYGQVVNLAAGNRVWFQRVAWVLAVTRSTMDVVEQAHRFRKSCKELMGEVRGEYPRRVVVGHKSALPFRVLEPLIGEHRSRRWRLKRARKAERIQEITRLTGRIFIELGKLVMKLADLSDAMAPSTVEQIDHNQEVFVNAYVIIKDLYQSKKTLVQGLREYTPTIYMIFQHIKPGFDPKGLIENLEEIVEWCDEREDGLYRVATTAMDIAVELKRGIEDKTVSLFYAMMGMNTPNRFG